jgi:hypothetical protein
MSKKNSVAFVIMVIAMFVAVAGLGYQIPWLAILSGSVFLFLLARFLVVEYLHRMRVKDMTHGSLCLTDAEVEAYVNPSQLTSQDAWDTMDNHVLVCPECMAKVRVERQKLVR